ncbi:Ankyrin repeats (many copies) [Oxalobacteraceae bacterium]
MDSSPVTPPPAYRSFSPPAISDTRAKKVTNASQVDLSQTDSPQTDTLSPRMVSRLPMRMRTFDRVGEDLFGDFSFDDLMIANGSDRIEIDRIEISSERIENRSDRIENAPGPLQYLPRLSLLCCHAHDTESLAIVRDALLSGENIHQKDPSYSRTPLHWACMFSSVAAVGLLLMYGATDDINEPDASGATPLACLLKNRELPGHGAMVWRLLEAGARLDLVEGGGQALMFQAYLTPALAGVLLQKGLRVNCTNAMRETPLLVASARGNDALVEFLLAHGADVNLRCSLGCTALHDGELDVDLAIRLLSAGALVDARDNQGQTPLMLACDFSNRPLIRLLLQHGASLAVRTHDGWSALDYAQNSGSKAYQCVLEFTERIPGARPATT